MPDWLLIILIIVGALLLLFLIFFIINGAIFAHLSFRRRPGDAHFAENEDPRAKNDADRIWFFSQKIEELSHKSFDGLNLKGYFLNNHSDKLAILVHGYHGRYYSVVSQARIFFENGFDVLTINNRCHDTSEGKLITMGKNETKDLNQWIDLMIKRNPNYQIALYGISMGGHIACQTASQINVNEKVKCVVEDCGFNSLKKQLYLMVANSSHPFPKMVVNLGEIYSSMFHHFNYSKSLDKSFKNLKLPILIFHGSKDELVPVDNANQIERAVPENVYKEKHIFEGLNHTRCVMERKEDYKKIVTEFVNKYIK